MSQVAHMLPSIHLHVARPLVFISGEPGPMAPATVVPVEVMLCTNGLSASCSGPGLGISIFSGAALAPDGAAAGFAVAGFAVAGFSDFPDCAYARPKVQIDSAMTSLFMRTPPFAGTLSHPR